MSGIVLDSSIALTWCFRDQRCAYGDLVLGLLVENVAIVPALWWLEVANVTALAERRGGLSQSQRVRFFELLGNLRITTDPVEGPRTLGAVVDIALAHHLTVYDATFLEVAQRMRAPLATLDDSLRRAAIAAGVALLPGA